MSKNKMKVKSIRVPIRDLDLKAVIMEDSRIPHVVEVQVPKGEFCWDGKTHCEFCGEGKSWAMCKYFDNNHENISFNPYCDLLGQHLAYIREKKDDPYGKVPKPEICRRQ